MSFRFLHRSLGITALCLVAATLSWAEPVKLELGLGSLEQSKAYRLYLTRPQSELSKLIFLIDRFKEAKMKIVYDGVEYPPVFVARLARWFLPSHYHGEKAEKWIMVWCNKSYSDRKLIWVKDDRDRFKLSRELLIEELAVLEKVLLQNNSSTIPLPALDRTDAKV